MIQQSFEEGAKACFIDEIFDARRQCYLCTFQHLETPLTFEALQHKNSTHPFPKPKIYNQKISIPKKIFPQSIPHHKIKSMPHQNVTSTKFITYPYNHQIFP